MGHGSPLLDLYLFDLIAPKDVRDELLGNSGELDDEDVPVQKPSELSDILAPLPDCAADLPGTHDENDPVRRVEAVHHRRPRHVLEK